MSTCLTITDEDGDDLTLIPRSDGCPVGTVAVVRIEEGLDYRAVYLNKADAFRLIEELHRLIRECD